MIRPHRSILILTALLVIGSIRVAVPMPILMDSYNEHPQSLQTLRDECVICHVNEDGSGALTAFGDKYDRVGLRYTPQLVAEYPNLFRVEGGPEPVAGAAAAATAVAVPGNEPFDARDYYRAECVNCHGKYGDGDPFQGVPAFATQKWLDERSAQKEELVRILLDGKDKMIGHAGKITPEDAGELVDLVVLIAKKYA